MVQTTQVEVQIARLHKRNVLEKKHADAVRFASNPFVHRVLRLRQLNRLIKEIGDSKDDIVANFIKFDPAAAIVPSHLVSLLHNLWVKEPQGEEVLAGIPILSLGQDRFDETLEDSRDIAHAVLITVGQATHTTLDDANRPVRTTVNVGRFMANKTDAASGGIAFLFVKDKLDLLAPYGVFRKSLITFDPVKYPRLSHLTYISGVWAADTPRGRS